jgi:NagD protein
MLLFRLTQLGVSPKDAVMVGDRLYTDIKMGKNAGVSTCLCLSGETTLNMIENSEDKPDYIINGIWELLEEFSKI